MQNFKRILVGVDLSDEEHFVADAVPRSTRAAVDKAIWLARRTSGHLTFHATVMPDYGRFISPPEEKSEGELVYEAASEILEGFCNEAEQAGLVADLVCTCGTPSLELTRAVIESHYDVVILGSHRRHGLRRLVLGSTGKKMLRVCPSPVWVTSPHDDGAVRKILAATDFSETSEQAVQVASELANQFKAELHVLHSVPQYAEPLYRGIPLPPGEDGAWQAKASSVARVNLNESLKKLGLADSIAPDHVHLVQGPANPAIQSVVHDLGIDLLVMGTAARRGLGGILIGNTAEQLLPHLTCSVLVLKPAGFHTRIEPHRLSSRRRGE
ncbi:MAG: universal stress protein [Rhodopirellula sp.]|nr:universal stress protein [Rhodopirellula sp.]